MDVIHHTISISTRNALTSQRKIMWMDILTAAKVVPTMRAALIVGIQSGKEITT